MDIHIEIGATLKTTILWGIFLWGFFGIGKKIIFKK